ncbi:MULTISPECIES: transcriptional regulator CynR [Pseudomonas syringae group]|uniref:HTH-type transcriptional regulator CynR n=2 Tax=Pseudomonas syringae group TaxID=136849 RepID=A0A2K4WSE9_PSESX|nr:MULTISPECIES: transcriptional regulator CynR [Pseudomonas syringae group]KWS54532.1 transcriptional regulator [Pseudomonas amygdali pv. morsprunorum]KWS58399.1 transcriptional regulator [Pseudomonas amygdali pv. morsprunorum]MBI6728494.1 transcriptional regulator CynR [Pseudomonas amygdali]MBI6810290.1 transcriptional regulator CynR [Pseudomonas amygdali]MDT3224274.1 transcriptional regulator CynR [Pseudomonas amygdali pv. morsprunorum]
MIIAIILPYGDAVLLRHIRYLLAVSDHGNFTRAAEALHVSQPALSQQIRQLESSLGVQLFDRTRRSVVPTDAGRVYLDHARRCLLELEAGKRALNDVSDLSRGQLRLGVTPTFSEYLIAPLIDRFSALYPGVAIILTELPLEQITEALINEALDLAIGFAGSHAVEIESQPLFDEQLCLVMAKSAPEKQTALTLEDLQTLRFALLAPGFATRQLLDAWCQTQNFKPTVGLEANSIAILLKVVAQGRMATILPDAIVREQPGLREVQTTPALPGRTVALLRRKNGYQSAAANAFAKLVSNSTQT